jgi:hypothetical protein
VTDYGQTLQERFRAAADAVAAERPEVDRDIARELMAEAATMLYDGLALDAVDQRDLATVIDGIAQDLVAADPGQALRESAARTTAEPGSMHDPAEAAAAYLSAAQTLRL